MELRQLLTEEDAVSPVIGVILMVAITVILAAVIGTFVLGLGENVNDSAPQANFQFEYDQSTSPPGVTITHTGGEDVDVGNVEVQGASGGSWSGSTISTGTTWSGTVDATSTETVRVVWSSPSGGSSQTIGQSTVPS